MSDTFRALVNRVVTDALARGATDVPTICEEIGREHPEAMAAHGEQLAADGLRRKVKELLSRRSEDAHGGQIALPGMHMPAAIAFPRPDGPIGYVRSDLATLEQLRAGRELRVANITAAEVQLEHYDRALDLLTPVMEANPGLRAGDALRLVREEDTA